MLGIHSMELKGHVYDKLLWLAVKVNPFNGIERGFGGGGEANRRCHGIHSMELKATPPPTPLTPPR